MVTGAYFYPWPSWCECGAFLLDTALTKSGRTGGMRALYGGCSKLGVVELAGIEPATFRLPV